jgi:hypothetical protein
MIGSVSASRARPAAPGRRAGPAAPTRATRLRRVARPPAATDGARAAEAQAAAQGNGNGPPNGYVTLSFNDVEAEELRKVRGAARGGFDGSRAAAAGGPAAGRRAAGARVCLRTPRTPEAPASTRHGPPRPGPGRARRARCPGAAAAARAGCCAATTSAVQPLPPPRPTPGPCAAAPAAQALLKPARATFVLSEDEARERIGAILGVLEARDPGQREFHQAVYEVVESVLPLFQVGGASCGWGFVVWGLRWAD